METQIIVILSTRFCTYFDVRKNYIKLFPNGSRFFFPYCTRWSKSMEEIHNHRFNISSSPGDNSHPSLEGTYLASCIQHFSKIAFLTRRTPGMNAANCAFLQNISNTIVFDSLAYWLQNENVCDNPTNLTHQISFSTSDTLSAICDLSWNAQVQATT